MIIKWRLFDAGTASHTPRLRHGGTPDANARRTKQRTDNDREQQKHEAHRRGQAKIETRETEQRRGKTTKLNRQEAKQVRDNAEECDSLTHKVGQQEPHLHKWTNATYESGYKGRDTLVGSMVGRIQECIDRKGAMTKK